MRGGPARVSAENRRAARRESMPTRRGPDSGGREMRECLRRCKKNGIWPRFAKKQRIPTGSVRPMSLWYRAEADEEKENTRSGNSTGRCHSSGLRHNCIQCDSRHKLLPSAERHDANAPSLLISKFGFWIEAHLGAS